MLERTIERYLCRQVELRQGRAYKWASPGLRGVPDRLVILPGGRLLAVEVKAPGKTPTVLQARIHAELRALGLEVAVVASFSDVDNLFSEMK